MATTIFYVIVSLVIFDFLFEQFLAWLNRRNWTNELPDELKDVYDAETYRKSQDYKRENERFSILTSSFSFLLLMAMFIFQGFALLDIYLNQSIASPLLVSLAFFGILFFVSDIIGIPFSIYDTFVIEEKYGFNKTTPKLFITDKLKSYLLTIILGGSLLSLFIWFYMATGHLFWFYTWIAATGFMLFMFMFYSNLIVPLFNKQTPLEEGELRNAISAFAQKAGFELKDIYVIDGSKRSTKANAYFTGLGSKKRIVLYDTLIKQMTTNEIVAVLSHEIGHYKHKHTLQSLVISTLQNGFTLYVLSLLLNYPVLSQALGVEKPALHIGIIVFAVIYTPVSMITGMFTNMLSRRNEYQADAYTKAHGLGDELISGLKKLSKNNFSNLTPHPLYVFFHYSHPTLLQRIRAIKS